MLDLKDTNVYDLIAPLAITGSILVVVGLIAKEVISLITKKYFYKIDQDYITMVECDKRRETCKAATEHTNDIKGLKEAFKILILHSAMPVEDQERALRALG